MRPQRASCNLLCLVCAWPPAPDRLQSHSNLSFRTGSPCFDRSSMDSISGNLPTLLYDTLYALLLYMKNIHNGAKRGVQTTSRPYIKQVGTITLIAG